MRSSVSSAAQKGFTLIELLVGVGIVGLLSSIVIVAINPTKQLEDAEHAARLVSAREIEKAMTQYIIDTLDDAEFATQEVGLAEGSAHAVPICHSSIDGSDCISLHSLVPDYIVSIPEEADFPNPNHSGYCIYLRSSRYQIFSVYDMPEGASCAGDEDLVLEDIPSAEAESVSSQENVPEEVEPQEVEDTPVISSSASATPTPPGPV